MKHSLITNQEHILQVLGVALNGAITFASNFYPGSRSDKAKVQQCGIFNQLTPGDLLADKVFIIHDIMPRGVSMNLHKYLHPPFLMKSQFRM